MNKIQKEQKDAVKYLIQTSNNLVDITQDNVARIEAMIKTDSAYRNSTNKNLNGSCAFCMNNLKKILINGTNISQKEYRKIVNDAVVAVDKENSTHLNADKCGREEITNRIVKIEKSKLIEYLRNPDGTGLKLINIISKETHPDPKKKTSSGYKYLPRKNISFASKFCHYACLYLFEGKDEQDNYSIYDGVLIKAIPKYAKYYSVITGNLKDYRNYRKVVDEIILKSNSGVSRNGFDHLLWYYHKGEK